MNENDTRPRVLVASAPMSVSFGEQARMNIAAVAGPDIMPGSMSEGNVQKIHLSELLREAWADAEVIVSDGQAKAILPELLGLGIPATRILLWHDRKAMPLSDSPDRMPSVDAKLAALMNKHVGRRAFILGNGPSLKVDDFELLKDDITFASNKIYLAFGQTTWRPTYYTVCDYLVAQNNTQTINELDFAKIFPRALVQYGCTGENVIWYDERFENKFFDAWTEDQRKHADFLFSRDARYGLQGGYTVIYHQLQLAYFMGIREVYLIGVDFHFDVPKTVSEDARFTSNVYRKALAASGEINHFHPDYRKPGEKWSLPRLDLQSHAFRSAGRVFLDSHGSLINASRRTKLTVLPRYRLEDL